ncbi:putative integral membrane protein [Babesia bovis T2Bo]|uniref:Nucleoside transporter family protein n=1 Tax=Babesia bovis TaxID=5865 RepID=A7AVI2_BABBO|nr:putative integral membrane protein [Babesia bovis T2Bo]EDO05808.1 putative integral membrane protein [Babesia bovis T2Bo]|eukprot:XP_001609376.1 hypothetical protein [Babesia bovis T2Bo]
MSQNFKNMSVASNETTNGLARDLEDNRKNQPNPAYMMFTAISQGFCVMLNLHVMFMMSGMAPAVLGVENFASLVVFTLEGAALLVNIIIFWMNPLKPWFTVFLCLIQAIGNAFQIFVVSKFTGTLGKGLYLGGTAALGAIFGSNIITSFTFIAFGPVNHLGAFSFGFAIGGIVPFTLSVILQNTVFTSNSADDVRKSMYCIISFVICMSIVSAINLAIYFTRASIKEHYKRVEAEGLSTVKCTFRDAMKGLKYAWKIVVVQFLSYMNLLTFYPGVVPSCMDLPLNRKIMLIGVFQISETVGRGIAVFIEKKYLLCNTLTKVMVLTVANIGTAIFLLCAILYHQIVFFNNIVSITIGIITLGAVGGYCNSFADRCIREEIPEDLGKEVTVSATTVFRIIVTGFCVLGSLGSTFLVPAIPKIPEPVVKAAEQLAEKVAEGAGAAANAASTAAEAGAGAAANAAATAGAMLSETAKTVLSSTVHP